MQVAEENGEEENEGGEEEVNQEEGVVDEDSTDGSAEGEEEWGTNSKDNQSA